jgi:hypothetical protein
MLVDTISMALFSCPKAPALIRSDSAGPLLDGVRRHARGLQKEARLYEAAVSLLQETGVSISLGKTSFSSTAGAACCGGTLLRNALSSVIEF